MQRTSKWSRRHSAVKRSAILILILFLITAGSLLSTWLIWQARQETFQALRAKEDALAAAEEANAKAQANFRKATEAVQKILPRAGELRRDRCDLLQARRVGMKANDRRISCRVRRIFETHRAPLLTTDYTDSTDSWYPCYPW